MTKKSVCTKSLRDLRRMTFPAIMAMSLVLGGVAAVQSPAYAAAGFTSLKDIEAQAEPQTMRATPVLSVAGVQIVFDPKAVAEAVKDYAIQQAMQIVQRQINNNLVRGFLNLGIALADNANIIGNIIGASTQEKNALDTRIKDVDQVGEIRTATGVAASAANRVAEAATVALCVRAADDRVRTRGAPVGEVGSGGHPVLVSARNAYQAMRAGNPTAGDIAATYVALSMREATLAATNSIGFPGDRGAGQLYKDNAERAKEYTSCDSGYGAARGSGNCTDDPKRVGLDLRTDFFTNFNKTPDAMTLHCTARDASGNGNIGRTATAHCDRTQTWESRYGGDSKLQPQPSFGDTVAILDKLVPPPLPPFNARFYRTRDESQINAELDFRRSQYEAARNAVLDTLISVQADYLPVKYPNNADKQNFIARYNMAYDEKTYPPPNAPSNALRRAVLVDYYQSPEFAQTVASQMSQGDYNALMMEAKKFAQEQEAWRAQQSQRVQAAIEQGRNLMGQRDQLQRAIEAANNQAGDT